MDFKPTRIQDVIILSSKVFQDSRGIFLETYRYEEFIIAGIRERFIQDNHAGSKQGVLRGLHYQIQQPQGKLVRAVTGKIFDVAVDLRKSSPTFGQSVGVILDDQERKQLWIPAGFAHGYYVMSEWAEVSYKVTNYYAPEWERTLLWNDPTLQINWPLIDNEPPILSPNDFGGKLFHEVEIFE
jgi:dTDP-4-dehydrorhamnose 3,5-epimerase